VKISSISASKISLSLSHTPLVEMMPACEKLKLPIKSWYLKIWMTTARFMGNNSVGSVRILMKKGCKILVKKALYPTGKHLFFSCRSNVSEDETGN